MNSDAQVDAAAAPPYVSTGHLPPPEQVRELVAAAYERFRSNEDGKNADVYPALAAVPEDLFGVCVVATSGDIYAIGASDYHFSIMSVSKPFVFALVCQAVGAENARERLGVNATGLPFNSLAAIERGDDGRTNPMVNSGAIATTSLVPGSTLEARVAVHPGRLVPLCGPDSQSTRTFTLPQRRPIIATGRSPAPADLWSDRLDPAEATELYTRQCALNVSAKDLAVMGATLADGGVNPLTRERVVDAHSCKFVLAVMATAGLYETSGDWLYDVGLPGKSGIGGGIVTVSPGKGGLGPSRRGSTSRQQRQGPAYRAVPVRTAGVEPVRVATRSLTAPVLSLG